MKATVHISASRSYASLAKAILTVNENLYGDDLFSEDRIEFKDVYAKDGTLTHFEITASPLDFFQIGLRYGTLEEAKRPRLAYRELADMVENLATSVALLQK
jgi:hypothetical protein